MVYTSLLYKRSPVEVKFITKISNYWINIDRNTAQASIWTPKNNYEMAAAAKGIETKM